MPNHNRDDHFIDLEIRIFPKREQGYPVYIKLGDGRDFERGFLAGDVLPWLLSGDLATDGQRLFDTLFADPKLCSAWDVACGKSPQRRIRLWIDADAPELHALPWELLRDGDVLLSAGASTPFSRYLPVAEPWGGPVAERPIRVLAVIASPDDLDMYNLAPLNVETERALLKDAFGDLPAGQVQLTFLDAPVTLERLERELGQGARGATGYHVLHFVGHGTFSQRREQAALYLQDEDGNTHIVTDDDFIAMLKRQPTRPRLVFLAACQSATRSTADAFAGLGPKLSQAGVPAVVTMQDAVAIQTVQKMTTVFYEHLTEHGAVDLALNTARSLLLTTDRPDAAVPVLFMRLKDGQVWVSQSEGARAARTDTLLHRVAAGLQQTLLGDPKARRELRNRQVMLKLVHSTWVEGVLEQSLHGVALLELGMEARAEAVERPWDVVVQTLAHPDDILPRGARIINVFDEMNSALLILGEPGSGKTTMLLELARDTIARAQADHTQPIPVILNLASWAERRLPIADWVVEEFNNKYHIPKKIARPWVENDELVLLLDGLDEVKAEHRNDCVEAINTFRRDHGLTPLVVCSRVADYKALTARLQLQGAVLLQPLAPEQVDQYLAGAGDGLAAVHEMLQDDPTLQELARSPLMLSIMTLAYRGMAVQDLQALDTSEARRKHLFDAYVQRMFKRRGAQQPHTPQQTVKWLAWLGRGMVRHGHSVFQLEQLQPSWLATRAQRWGYVLISRLIGVLIALFIPVTTWSWSDELALTASLNALMIGLSVGIIDGLRFEWEKLRGISGQARRSVFWRAMDNVLGLGLGLTVTLLLVWKQNWDWTRFLMLGFFFCLPLGLRGREQHTTKDVRLVESLSWSWKRFLIPFSIIAVALGGITFGYISVIHYYEWDRKGKLGNHVIVWDARFNVQDFDPNFIVDPNRKRVLKYSDSVNLWDLEKNTLIATFEGAKHDESYWYDDNAFSPDGKRLLIANQDGTVHLWDGENGTHIMLLKDSTGISSAGFSPDGKYILTIDRNGTVHLWDSEDYDSIAILETIVEDSEHLITVPRWNSDDYDPIARCTRSRKDSVHVDFSPDGKRILTIGQGGTVQLWNSENGALIATLEDTVDIECAKFSPDGKRILTTTYNAVTQLWDGENGVPIATLGINFWYLDDAFSPDGKRILTIRHGIVQLWSVQDGDLTATLECTVGQIRVARFSLDGKQVVTVAYKEPSWALLGNYQVIVQLWDENGGLIDTERGLPRRKIEQWQGVLGAFSPDEAYIVHIPAPILDRRVIATWWLVLGSIAGILAGLRVSLIETKVSPNQGVRLSVRNAFLLSLVGWMLGIIVQAMLYIILETEFVGIILFSFSDILQSFWLSPGSGITTGVLFALWYGGLDVIQHYILRLLLKLTGKAPWRYARFLDYAAERIFLRQVGGGYIFVHRLLQEYFVSLGGID